MKKKLAELRAKIKSLSIKADLSDDEAKDLQSLMADAVKLEAQIEAQEQIAKSEADAKAEADAAQQAAIDAAVKAEREKVEKEFAVKARRLSFGQAPYQAEFSDTWKYDNLSPGEIGLAIHLGNGLTKANNAGHDVRFGPDAYKALALRLIDDKRDFGDRDLSQNYSLGAMKAAGVPTTVDAVKAATDPMYTGGTTDGGNWVHTSYARELWAVLRAPTSIVAKIPTQIIEDGSKSSTIPIEGTDLTWYSAPEASSTDATLKLPAPTIDGTQITTPTNKEITVAKMGARGWYTGEMTEDSIIKFVPQLRSQLEISGAEQLEHAVIDGDTETGASANINKITGTPTSTGTARDLYLIMNGFRKYALVTNVATNARDGGTLTEDDYLETMWLLGTAGLGGSDLKKSSFIVNPSVYKKSLMLASLKTKDVWANATLENGVLTGLWGYGLMPSWFMNYKSASRQSNSAGKVDQTTAANNAYGTILGVRWDQWKFAYKRAMTVETTRVANADAYEIVAWARVGMNSRDATNAASATYNITV